VPARDSDIYQPQHDGTAHNPALRIRVGGIARSGEPVPACVPRMLRGVEL
jgi:hypothetical protein